MRTTLRLARPAPRDTHALHRAVHAAAPPIHGRTLWALPDRHTLVIRSGALNAEKLPVEARAHAVTAERDDHPPGTRLAWSLIANPVKALPSPKAPDNTRPRGKRVPLEDGEVEAWARTLLAPALDVDALEWGWLPPAVGRQPKTGRVITLTRAALAGTATVTDPAALHRMLTEGVGRGRAFGCGLLLTQACG